MALKVLKDAWPSARVMERFFREARAVARDHPSIVPLHDAGRDAGRCWIAYEFIAGRTLDHLCTGGDGIDHRRAARLARDLADALDHAHRGGVVHRGVKPTNVILDESGRPRLIDFGLARRTDLDPTLTVEGTVLGTPAYMSPEQAAGFSHQADARSDIFSLGVLFHELLCGRRLPNYPSNLPASATAASPAPSTASVAARWRATPPTATPTPAPWPTTWATGSTATGPPAGRTPERRGSWSGPHS